MHPVSFATTLLLTALATPVFAQAAPAPTPATAPKPAEGVKKGREGVNAA